LYNKFLTEKDNYNFITSKISASISKQMKEYIEIKDINYKSNIFMVRIKNFAAISAIYSADFASYIVIKIQEYLIGNLEIFADKLTCDTIIICNKNQIDKNEFANLLHRMIQMFPVDISDNNTPLYVKSLVISSDYLIDSNLDDIINNMYVLSEQERADELHHNLDVKDFNNKVSLAKDEMIKANKLQMAIKNQKLLFAYQPIIDIAGKTAHYEALLRFEDETGRILSVGPLIPVAEKLGFIDIIDEIILDMAFKELSENPDLHLSINLSNLGIVNERWLEKANKLLDNKADISARMMVEITETALQSNIPKAAYFIATLQGLGCKVALDDFGVGYTSLHQLRSLSVDVIKIDGSFVRDIAAHSDNMILVQLLIEITKKFNIESIAEFVDSGETAKILIEMGIDHMQGNFFAAASINKPWKIT
jgi:c-di-GMP phosphodiesterase